MDPRLGYEPHLYQQLQKQQEQLQQLPPQSQQDVYLQQSYEYAVPSQDLQSYNPYILAPASAASSHAYAQPPYDQSAQISSLPAPDEAFDNGQLEDSPETDSQDEDLANAEEAKKARACESCRGLKVKCEPHPTNSDSCKRCAKAGRQCIVTQPNRKRQKKADSRVAELEQKIEALTKSLEASHALEKSAYEERERRRRSRRHGSHRTDSTSRHSDFSSSLSSFGLPRKRVRTYGPEPDGPLTRFDERSKTAAPSSPQPLANFLMPKQSRLRTDPSLTPSRTTDSRSNDYGDPIDRNVLTLDQAAMFFDRYVKEMVPYFPAVVFPPETTPADVRKSKPLVFLAILAAASGRTHPELQKVLNAEVNQILAESVMLNGEKSLEVVQALQIHVIWYLPPEHFEELKFCQLLHMAAIMAIDLEMTKLPKPGKKETRKAASGYTVAHSWKQKPRVDPSSIESKRAWLVCWHLCCNISMGMRRTNLVPWTPFLDLCVESLQSSEDALPSDKLLVAFAKAQHIVEDVGTAFRMDDPLATAELSDPSNESAIRGFEARMKELREQIPDPSNTLLKMHLSISEVYIHEISLHVNHNVEDYGPPYVEAILDPKESTPPDCSSSVQIDSLKALQAAGYALCDQWLTLSVDQIRILPTSNYVRLCYVLTVITKMYTYSAGHADFAKVIPPDAAKLESYLSRLLQLLRASSEEDRCRPAMKASMMVIMYKTWLQRKLAAARQPSEQSGGTPSQGEPSDERGSMGPPSTTGAKAISNASMYSIQSTNSAPLNRAQSMTSAGSKGDVRQPSTVSDPSPRRESNFRPAAPAISSPLHVLSEAAADFDNEDSYERVGLHGQDRGPNVTATPRKIYRPKSWTSSNARRRKDLDEHQQVPPPAAVEDLFFQSDAGQMQQQQQPYQNISNPTHMDSAAVRSSLMDYNVSNPRPAHNPHPATSLASYQRQPSQANLQQQPHRQAQQRSQSQRLPSTSQSALLAEANLLQDFGEPFYAYPNDPLDTAGYLRGLGTDGLMHDDGLVPDGGGVGQVYGRI